jgi:hypothetical protein
MRLCTAGMTSGTIQEQGTFCKMGFTDQRCCHDEIRGLHGRKSGEDIGSFKGDLETPRPRLPFYTTFFRELGSALFRILSHAAMVIMDRFRGRDHTSPASSTMIDQDPEKKPQMLKGGAKEIFRVRIIAMAIIVSMGGVCILQITCNCPRLTFHSSSLDTTLVKSLGSWRCRIS